MVEDYLSPILLSTKPHPLSGDACPLPGDVSKASTCHYLLKDSFGQVHVFPVDSLLEGLEKLILRAFIDHFVCFNGLWIDIFYVLSTAMAF